MLPVSINGIGLREGAFVVFFSSLGVPPHAALALAWLEYGILLVQGLVCGLVYATRR
jgi:hypothetical protein